MIVKIMNDSKDYDWKKIMMKNLKEEFGGGLRGKLWF